MVGRATRMVTGSFKSIRRDTEDVREADVSAHTVIIVTRELKIASYHF